MSSTIGMIQTQLEAVFEKLGYDAKLAVVKKSDRPDLSDFQCNAAMKIAGMMKQKPVDVANKIAAAMSDEDVFSAISVAGPGFINFTLKDAYLEKLVNIVKDEDRKNLASANPQKIVIDYGGPNVAKPLHVGHLRSAIVGDSIKRIAKYLGHTVISDVHLGDWGTPMGMLIAALSEEHPEWPYFSGGAPYPNESPIAVDDLNALYPRASERFKNDPAFADKAREATVGLQNGHPGYRALWEQFIKISVQSVKSDYDRLGVSFDLWLGESDAAKHVPQVEEIFKEKELLVESQGAQVVEVSKANDNKAMPPLIFRKEDGGLTYATTDLATILMRKDTFSPDSILYVVDQRQSLHFEQVFRAAHMAGLIQEGAVEHIGFGTLNGKDGKPFKTRQGGVMRLTSLIDMATEEVMKRVAGSTEKASDVPVEIQEMVEDISVAAIKFGDLSVQRQADYVFDLASFVQTEGKTGPYLQYAAVRVKSLLSKANVTTRLNAQIKITSASERDLAMVLAGFPDAVNAAFVKRMPSEICDYAYALATAYNRFYKECPILSAASDAEKLSRLTLSQTVLDVLEKSLDLLGIKAPQRMISYNPRNDMDDRKDETIDASEANGNSPVTAPAAKENLSQTSSAIEVFGSVPAPIQKHKGPAIISKQSEVEYDAVDFDKVKALASTLADVLEKKTGNLLSILTRIESHETALDEIEKSIDCLRNIDVEKENYVHRIGDTAVFMPLNLPLYSMVIFGAVPSFLSKNVSIRYPSLLSEISQAIGEELGISSILPNLNVQNVGKEEFVSRFVAPADATIFTGKKENIDKVRKKARKDSLILFNGRGVNPVVIGPDADLQAAIDKSSYVKIFNSGQDCAAADCLFVHESLSRGFVHALKSNLETIVVGAYSDNLVRVGPLIESEQLRVASEYLYKHADHIVLGGAVDFAKRTVHPALVFYPDFGAINSKELFSPVLHVVEYRDDKDLIPYFESSQYRNNAMYVSLFGKSDYLTSGQKHTIVLQDQNIHDFERGYKEYGGYSQGASFVQMGREITAQPILTSRELRRYAEWKRQPMPK